MKSRFTLWNTLIEKVARSTNPSVRIIGKDVVVQDTGIMRIGTHSDFEGQMMISSEHLEPILKSKEYSLDLDGSQATLRAKIKGGSSKSYTFGTKPWVNQGDRTIENILSLESVIQLDESDINFINEMKPLGRKIEKNTPSEYCGIYEYGDDAFFLSGSKTHAFIRPVDKFPLIPFFMGDPKMFDLFGEADLVKIGTASSLQGGSGRFIYFSSIKEDYEVALPCPDPFFVPDKLIQVFQRTMRKDSENAPDDVTIDLRASDLSNAIKEISNDLSRDPEALVTFRIQGTTLTLRARGRGVSSSVDIPAGSDHETMFSVRAPFNKEFDKLMTRMSEELTLNLCERKTPRGELNLLRIDGQNSYYITTILR